MIGGITSGGEAAATGEVVQLQRMKRKMTINSGVTNAGASYATQYN
jgi:hypothetical protein